MAKRSSAAIIAGMRERGWSLGQMGRVLGRDSSLLSQVARGSKPGANLQRELARLSSRTARVKDRAGYAKSHANALAPARRERATGEKAAVRRGWQDIPGTDRQAVAGTKIGPTFRKRLERAARNDDLVSISALYEGVEYGQSTATDRGAEATLAEHGWSAKGIVAALDKAGWAENPEAAFEAVMSTNPRLGARQGFERYALTAIPRKPR